MVDRVFVGTYSQESSFAIAQVVSIYQWARLSGVSSRPRVNTGGCMLTFVSAKIPSGAGQSFSLAYSVSVWPHCSWVFPLRSPVSYWLAVLVRLREAMIYLPIARV